MNTNYHFFKIILTISTYERDPQKALLQVIRDLLNCDVIFEVLLFRGEVSKDKYDFSNNHKTNVRLVGNYNTRCFL